MDNALCQAQDRSQINCNVNSKFDYIAQYLGITTKQ